jgi:predicted nucleic acid-binding protein
VTLGESSISSGDEVGSRPIGSDARLWLGDCVLLGTAQQHGASVVSSDRALLRIARAEGIEAVPVRDSAGRRAR